MRSILVAVIMLLNMTIFGQVYTFHKVVESNYTKISSDYFFESYINYDSAWVGLSDLGVIYIELYKGDTSFTKIMNRCELEDNSQINIMEATQPFKGSIIITNVDRSLKNCKILDFQDPEIQWDIEWVGEYFEYFREDGYDPDIVSIEDKNKGVLFKPIKISVY